MVQRHPDNPILTVDDIQPSIDGLEILGAFNPGVFQLDNKIVLLVRVAESATPEEGWVKVPVIAFDENGGHLEVKAWDKDKHTIDDSDPRHVVVDGEKYLTSVSHLRLARSTDGVNFSVASTPFLSADTEYEGYGLEDGRVVRIGDTFYITYTAISQDGFGVGLASTREFTTVERHGLIFPPSNKDVCLFPEKVGDRYIALHRPMPLDFGKPSIWYAESPDLLHWGTNYCLMRPLDNRWEHQKIGVGPEPIKTSQGWLLLYHGVGDNSVYSALLALLDLEDPRRVLKRGDMPILKPEDKWETSGLVPNVVFPNGWVKHPDGRIQIYYGASDESICLAETTEEELLAQI